VEQQHLMLSSLVHLNPDENEQANAAVDEFCARNAERDRVYEKERSASKAAMDNRVGKKAEFFVRKYITDRGIEVSPVDLTVITNRWKKTFDPDLRLGDGTPLHVKSCLLDISKTIRRPGYWSWTFQMTDSLFKSEQRELVAFICLKDAQAPDAMIHGIIPWDEIMPYLEDPKLAKYVGQKKCYTAMLTSDYRKYYDSIHERSLRR
jgi:hypothetical protein